MPLFLCRYSIFFYCKYVPYLNLSPFGDKYKVKVYIYKYFEIFFLKNFFLCICSLCLKHGKT